MLKYNLSQIDTISKKILSNLSSTDCIFLFGELGSGKTTFTRSLINGLQEKNKVNKTEVLSPTFNLLYEYEIKSLKVMLYDLYRLKEFDEINNLGVLDDTKSSLILIEWPTLLLNNLSDFIKLSFGYSKDYLKRELYYENLLKNVSK